MSGPGSLRCSIPSTGWIRQGYPHITASIAARCNNLGKIEVEIADPPESATKGTVDAPLRQGEWTTFTTPSFPEPKHKPADVVVIVRTTCDAKPTSALARCTMP